MFFDLIHNYLLNVLNYGLNFAPLSPYVGVLNPNTSECDSIVDKGLKRYLS